MGHLGTRVSALLDGQLPPAEADRAWAHVHGCHVCRDLVEREGWVKTRLSGLSGTPGAPTSAPDHLKGSLRCGAPLPSAYVEDDRPRRAAVVLLGGSAAGVAVLGVLALGLGQPGSPAPERRAPVTEIGGSGSDRPVPVRVPGRLLRESSPTPVR
jgi:hypothetical protein